MTVVDWAVIAILAISFLIGLAQGFFRSVCGLGGLLIGLVVAAWNYHHLAASLVRYVRMEAVAGALAFLLIALAVIVVAGLIGHLLAKAFRLIGLGWLDSLAGGVFGLFQGATCVVILILVMVAFFPQQQWVAQAQLPRKFFAACHIGSHVTPGELGERIRSGLASWEKQSPAWLHPQ